MNILILSAGTRNKIVQYFKKELNGEGRVIATDCSNLAPAIYEADKYYIVPRITDENYIDIILDICKKEKINTLISLIDPELSLIAKNIRLFKEIGVNPIISDYDKVEMCFDKYEMYKFLINNNFKGYKNGDKINIEGSYDINIWYSCMDDTKTEVVKKSTTYLESVVVPKRSEGDFSNEEVIIRSLKQPTCTRAEIVNGKTEYTVEKELGVEIVGDTKVKIAYDEEEDPWEIIPDDNTEEVNKAEKEIDEQVNEEYLD